jgi:glycosyltransferase involved in cell wall biosynthesis
MTVQILLSTYNGVKYLRPLVDSLLAQDYPNLEILVRDDGSDDGTLDLLNNYASTNSNIRVVPGANLGFAHSFFSLIEISSNSADYLALCDQDDVWLEDKVSRAVELVRRYPPDTPVMYCSRLTVVNKNLNVLGYTSLPRNGLSFRNALLECPQGLGCTILLNKAARELLREFPDKVYCHDWWIYLVMSCFGKIIFDEESKILYRLHDSNTFGIQLGFLDKWRTKIHRFKTGQFQLMMDQAIEFMRIYGSSLSNADRQVLGRFIENRERRWYERMLYALSCEAYHQSTLEHLVLRVLIALNRV